MLNLLEQHFIPIFLSAEQVTLVDGLDASLILKLLFFPPLKSYHKFTFQLRSNQRCCYWYWSWHNQFMCGSYGRKASEGEQDIFTSAYKIFHLNCSHSYQLMVFVLRRCWKTQKVPELPLLWWHFQMMVNDWLACPLNDRLSLIHLIPSMQPNG